MPRRYFDTCPRCSAPLRVCTSINGTASEFWKECTECNTYVNTYIPQAHQEAFHRDPHKFKGNFGGYGTGKTTTSREEVYKHLFLTPNGNTIIGAGVVSQYEQTIKRDIENDLPARFVKDSSVQKAYIDFINGHRIMFRPYDDQGKIRSYNVSMFVIVEASEVDAEIFSQLKTRNRNMAATLPETDANGNIIYDYTDRGVPIPRIKADWREGIIESNPDSGWIRTEVLNASSEIQKHGNVLDTYQQIPEEIDPSTSSHIAATDINKFLPNNFIEEITKNKPVWWINRYVKGSFSYAEGLVYPRAMECVIPTAPIPKHWKRLIAFDYGLSDDAVFLYGAVDEENGQVVIYQEQRTNNRSVEDLARIYFEGVRDIPSGCIYSQLIDPKSGPKRDYDKKSLSDHFLDYGIYFKGGHVGVEARVFRLNTYIESNKLKIMDCCQGLIKELREYKFPSKKLGQTSTAAADKPVDKNNHAINPLEWIVMELPADPRRIIYGVYNKNGDDVTKPHTPEARYMVHALSDPDEYNYNDTDSCFGIDFTHL